MVISPRKNISNVEHSQEIQWIIRDKYGGDPLKSELDKDLKRLGKGEPVDYIIGYKNFLDCKIDLSFRPLIPREETEYWVETMISSELSGTKTDVNILDIFAGSGCVGVAVLKNTTVPKVDFSEKNLEMIKQIKQNLVINHTDYKRYSIIESDLFENITKKYHYILANPPYCEETQLEKMDRSVYDYEPHDALFGGKDGLDVIRKFLEDAKNYLVPKGKIFMEFGEGQKDKIENILIENQYHTFNFMKDNCNIYRVVEIQH